MAIIKSVLSYGLCESDYKGRSQVIWELGLQKKAILMSWLRDQLRRTVVLLKTNQKALALTLIQIKREAGK